MAILPVQGTGPIVSPALCCLGASCRLFVFSLCPQSLTKVPMIGLLAIVVTFPYMPFSSLSLTEIQMVASQRALDMFAMLFIFFFKIQGRFSGWFFSPFCFIFVQATFCLALPKQSIVHLFFFLTFHQVELLPWSKFFSSYLCNLHRPAEKQKQNTFLKSQFVQEKLVYCFIRNPF